MILVIDVGNTNIVLGIYRGKELLHHWRLSTSLSATVDEYGVMVHNLLLLSKINEEEIDGVIISSVVPPIMHTIEKLCTHYLRKVPLIVGPGIKTGLNIRYENPRDVGADRIVNAIAAIDLYGPPLIVVDFGTATTFDFIDSAGQYIGGAISPGIGISTEALYQKTAMLRRIELVKPKSTVGRNTAASMQAGIIYGFAGQVDGIVERMEAEFKVKTTVIATGGLAELISSESKCIQHVNTMLTLQGLQIIYERNT